MLTGAVIVVVAAFTPIVVLEEMVNIGTLLAFVIVCGAVLLLRIRRPEATRPFRCPALFLVAPLGIARQRDHDAVPADRNLGAAGDLAGDRPGDLLRLRLFREVRSASESKADRLKLISRRDPVIDPGALESPKSPRL